MAIVSFGGMAPIILGAPMREGTPYLGTAAGTATLLDATLEACITVGQILTEDELSHTIDTSGSSSLGWLSGALTFANVGTSVKVGLATIDTGAGPPARATAVANLITFDVSKTMAGGGGGITANAWQEHVPDAGTKTIVHGDQVAFAVQMVVAAGADAVNVQNQLTATGFNSLFPSVTNYVGGSYNASTKLPNMVITFSDGKLGIFIGSSIYLTGTTTQSWNNTSGTKEYGNYLLVPEPIKIIGLIVNCNVAGNTDFILYSDPFGTPVAERTVSIDLNTIGVSATNEWAPLLFSTPYYPRSNQPLAAIMKPTSATTIASRYKTFQISGHQKTESLGTNCYAINRNTGAFVSQNSDKDRFAIGLLIGGGENPSQPIYALGI